MPAVEPGLEGFGGFVYGFALPTTSGGFGWAATIFRDRILATAKSTYATEASLLGSVMAHEVGHLLLGTRSHSSYGLMSANWEAAELQKIAEGAFFFVKSERKKIRDRVEARIAASGATGAVAQ